MDERISTKGDGEWGNKGRQDPRKTLTKGIGWGRWLRRVNSYAGWGNRRVGMEEIQ